MKTRWRNHKYLMIFRTASLLGVIGIAWLLSRHYFTPNPSWLSVGERLALLSFWVAIIGFALAIFGAYLAVLQFQAAQRKPDLHLWIGARGEEGLTLEPGRQWPLILENRGKGVARHVRVKVDFLVPSRTPDGTKRVALVKAISDEHWGELVTLGDHTEARFVGGDDYVCYDEDYHEFVFFRIQWTSECLKHLKQQFPIEYALRCEGMRRKEGTLTVKFPP